MSQLTAAELCAGYDGLAYELPTWEHRMDGSASSSSQDAATILRLPTPVAQDAKNSSNPPAAHARNTPPPWRR